MGLPTLAKSIWWPDINQSCENMSEIRCVGESISVCLLTYNHVDVIESTLKSILEQSVADFEVIISDDCSSDGTWERILELAADDIRIRPIRTPHNMGMPGNANYAVGHSNRPYIALLHHDDLYRRDLLEKWIDVAQRHPEVGFVFNPYGKFESSFIYSEPMPGEYIEGEWLLKSFLFPRWGCVVRGTTMIRRSAWDQIGGMREQFGLLADIDMWMRLAIRGPVGYVPEPVITVRQQRPSYYPGSYSGEVWDWKRKRILYEIHASNRLKYLDIYSVIGRLHWWVFRLRLNLETAKWLTYAVVRKKKSMLATSDESATMYDLWPLRLYRHILRKTFAADDMV